MDEKHSLRNDKLKANRVIETEEYWKERIRIRREKDRARKKRKGRQRMRIRRCLQR